ncbi:MAG: hypothetical protein QNJ75_09010 [Acidimicrobiia bacterium]|nr:hypothetical protein [Acidimicrobiia bacterium]
MRRLALTVIVFALATGGCSNLGLGQADCTSPDREVSAANILTIQAVPTARYTPCIRESRLGWDTVEWFAEDGRAGFKISRSITPFLTAVVTPACDITGATQVASGEPDIERFEDIESQTPEIGITIIPSSERALARSRVIVDQLDETEIDGRPVVFTIDEDAGDRVRARVNLAFLFDQYVWIMSELDAEEGKVELRGKNLIEPIRGLTPLEALDAIEDNVPDVFYKGKWYFVFDGGCITYEFNATGTLAETIAEDAEEVFGFYPARFVVEGARDEGLIIE